MRAQALAAAADGRRCAPAAARNLQPLTAALAALLPPKGRVLEVASGTGQHAAHWAGAFPAIIFQPSDPEPAARASIAAWRDHTALANLLAPLAVDVTAPAWWQPLEPGFDAIIAVNLTHIAPWQATSGLFQGADALLSSCGRLVVYGPFAEHGVLEPESNRLFDRSLRAQNPAWGVRDVTDLDALATSHALVRSQRIAMPANNLVLVWERRPCA